MVPVSVRPLAPADLPAVGAIVDATGLFPAAMLPELTAGALAGTDPSLWRVATGPDVLGVACCAPERLTSGTWNVLALAVAPAAQGRGVGRALMAHVEEALARAGARLVLVETSGLPAFARTRAFYAGIGYAHVATIPEFFDAGDDKVVFHKPLARTAG